MHFGSSDSGDDMTSATFEVESKLTSRYQTTVPAPIRRALKLRKCDHIRYSIQSDGSVLLARVTEEEAKDPAIGHFLAFLARDIEQHPERLQTFDPSLRDRIQSLVGHINVDLNATLSPDDE
jgi:antitoxin PrlF